MKSVTVCIILLLMFPLRMYGQERVFDHESVKAVIDKGDTIPYVALPEVHVFPPYKFANRRQEEQYWRMIRDVKKVLPLAKIIRTILIETYEVLETIPTEKERIKHLKAVEKQMFEDYKPQMKQLTINQGKLLIRLVDRYCNQSSYDILKAYLGGFRAGFWQTFAYVLGASLKTEWDPQGKDAMLERIVVLVEMGAL